MKLQEVFLRAIAKKITWLDAAEIAGLSVVTMDGIRQKFERSGYDGLYDQPHRKRYIHRVPLATVEKVLALYQQSYSGLNARHFHQKLRAEHGIRLSYSWVKQALQGSGLIAVPKKRRQVPPTRRVVAPGRHRLQFVRSSSNRRATWGT